MTTLSRLLAMQAQLDKCFREGCVAAMEHYERERPLGTHIEVSHGDRWFMIQKTIDITFRYANRIRIERLEVHP